jgi:DNA-binding transcriptional LysR family regulator
MPELRSHSMGDDDIRTFLAIAKNGSVAAAARSLSMSEPDFVVEAEALRSGRGARMIERTASGYALIAQGCATLAHFEWIKDEVLAAERSRSR